MVFGGRANDFLVKEFQSSINYLIGGDKGIRILFFMSNNAVFHDFD